MTEFNDRRPGRTKSQVTADRKAILDQVRRKAAGEDIKVRGRKSDWEHLKSTGRVQRGESGWTVKEANRREPHQVEADRQSIIQHVQKNGGSRVRPPEGARANDIDHLVKQGHLERTVKEEYDRQQMRPGNNYFGGGGSVKRKRAYLSLPQPRERTDG